MIPNAITHNALASAFGKGEQLVQALGVFEAMRCQALVPDAITYNALVSACEKGK